MAETGVLSTERGKSALSGRPKVLILVCHSVPNAELQQRLAIRFAANAAPSRTPQSITRSHPLSRRGPELCV